MLAKILWSGEMQKISAIFLNQDNETPNFAELKLLAEYPNQDEAFCALQNILIQLLNKIKMIISPVIMWLVKTLLVLIRSLF
jgi:hypothetical protein